MATMPDSCRSARSARGTGCRTRTRSRPTPRSAARRALPHRRTADRGGVVRAPEGDPADGRRRRGVAGPAGDGVRYSALVPNTRGAQRALAAGFTEIEVVVSASDTHNRRNVNRSTDESLDDIAELIDLLHGAGASAEVIVATTFGCPYEGDVDPQRVARIVTGSSRTARTRSRSATPPAWAPPAGSATC